MGRIVGDRAVARLVFGTEGHTMRMKTAALSTQVDLVSDDAIPNIQNALRQNGIEPRPYARGRRADAEQPRCPRATN